MPSQFTKAIWLDSGRRHNWLPFIDETALKQIEQADSTLKAETSTEAGNMLAKIFEQRWQILTIIIVSTITLVTLILLMFVLGPRRVQVSVDPSKLQSIAFCFAGKRIV